LSGFNKPGKEILTKTLKEGTDSRFVKSSPHGDLVSGIAPVFSRTESKAVVGMIIMAKFVPATFVNRLKVISNGLQEYEQLKMLKKPIKTAI
ncbi:MAG: hypothetical protein MUP08_06770, partial [Desulfobulbaceae bacterium]|nr:hypothetical protein [Desulfobulbaceae bacterium]